MAGWGSCKAGIEGNGAGKDQIYDEACNDRIISARYMLPEGVLAKLLGNYYAQYVQNIAVNL